MRTATPPQPIYVRQPCAENYDAMNSVEGGKFCGSCQHVVHDFTDWKQEDIVQFLKAQNGKVCGHFRNEQLGTPRKPWFTALKVSVLAAVALWFSNNELKAQKTQTDVVSTSNTVSDSVVVLLRGEIKSDGKKVYRSTVEARDSSGNVIATARSYDGRFELHVPVGYPKQPFTIVVTSQGYRDEVIVNYISAAGNVLAIDMTRRLFGKPSKPFRTVGCPSF